MDYVLPIAVTLIDFDLFLKKESTSSLEDNYADSRGQFHWVS